MDPGNPTFLYFLFGGLFLIATVSIFGGFMHTRRERLLTHAERMKSLELGRDVATDPDITRSGKSSIDDNADDSKSLPRKCFSTAFWVAFWGFLAAGSSGIRADGWANPAISIAIAASVAAIGVTALICGTVLAFRSSVERTSGSSFKAPIDADALDVVSRRG
jgi:hypothetical protein